MSKMNGSCLCGSIRYTCNSEPLLTAVCHCPHCQKQSGTSFSVIVAVPKDSLTIAGQTLTVTQAAVGCTYAISPASQSVVAGGATGSTAVAAATG